MTFGWVTAVGDTRINDFYELVAAAFLNGRADADRSASAATITFTSDGLTYTASVTGSNLTYDADGVPQAGVLESATIRDAGGNDLLYLHNFDIQVAGVAAVAQAERLGHNPIALETYIGTWGLMYFSQAAIGEDLLQSQPIGPDDWSYEPTGPLTLHLAGASTLYLGAGSDWVETSLFDDVILGGAGNDMIFTNDGADIVTPGQGNDQTYADANDTIVFWGASTDFDIRAVMMGFLYVYVDDMRPNAPEGHDTIRADAVNLEFADVTLILSLEDGVPVFRAGVGVTIYGTSAPDVIAPYALPPTGQPRTTPFADTIYGLGGNDVLDGGRGGDLMYGGTGDDTYYVDHMSDRAIETGGAAADGYDTVIADFDFQLGDYVERLILKGGAGADSLIGDAGADTIQGGTGADLLTGGADADTFEWLVRDTAADRVTDFVAGTDRLQFSKAAFDFNGLAFDARTTAGSTATNITGADLVVYTGGTLNGTADARAYLAAAAGGSAGEGLFLLGTAASGHALLFHAKDASFAFDDVALVADLGTVSASSIQLGDFAFV